MNDARAVLAAGLLAAAACDWSAQRMVDQDRCERDEPTRLFPDGDCDRPAPAGVVQWQAPRGRAERPPLTPELLARGRGRFDLVCAPCHGLVGDGRSQVAENMLLRAPPSLHEARVLALDDAKLYDVISEGYGLMPAHRAQLPDAADRWAIVDYVRVLEASQDAGWADLPHEIQEEAAPWLR